LDITNKNILHLLQKEKQVSKVRKDQRELKGTKKSMMIKGGRQQGIARGYDCGNPS